MTRRELSASSTPCLFQNNSHRWLRILRVICAKLRLDGTFDFNALGKATPGYVGADLSALAGAAGIIAVKRIFKSFSDDTIVIPDNSASTLAADSAMQVDVSHSVPVPAISSPPTPSPGARPGELVASYLSITNLPIANFLQSHPAPLTPAQLAPLCITAADFMLALKEIQPSAQREGFATVPDVTWSDIGALHATRSELHMAVVQPIRRPELFRAVASFISVKGPELLNKVRQIFSYHPGNRSS
jgi:ribosome biogenesis ATPase